MPRDLPERYQRPERPGAAADLVGRLDRLPPAHPSSLDYHSRDAPAERAESADRDGRAGEDRLVPAAERPEWRQLLARAEVDRVGAGIVDERASRFRPEERRVADFLAGEGRAVVAIHNGFGDRRRPDAMVDDIPTEFKSLGEGARNETVRNALNSAKGQARHAIVDARGSGLECAEAERGIRRFLGTPWAGRLDTIRVIGDEYGLDWKRG